MDQHGHRHRLHLAIRLERLLLVELKLPSKASSHTSALQHSGLELTRVQLEQEHAPSHRLAVADEDARGLALCDLRHEEPEYGHRQVWSLQIEIDSERLHGEGAPADVAVEASHRA